MSFWEELLKLKQPVFYKFVVIYLLVLKFLTLIGGALSATVSWVLYMYNDDHMIIIDLIKLYRELDLT